VQHRWEGRCDVSLSNDSTLKLNDVRHVLKLKRNLISVCQLVDTGMNTTFDDDLCKITKGAMIITHDKKEGTLYMMLGSTTSILVASSNVGMLAHGIADLGI